jgi:carbonic anhydrase
MTVDFHACRRVGATLTPVVALLLACAHALASDAPPAPAASASAPRVADPGTKLSAMRIGPNSTRPDPAASKPAPAPDQGDEVLRKMLAGRLAGGGELVLKTSDAPALRPRVEAKGKARAVPAEPAASLPAPAHAPHWDYLGAAGPDAWSQLSSEYALCAKGQRQSPIDIRDGFAVQLDPIRFDYQTTPLRVIDNGHTVQVSPRVGSGIELSGRRFDLVQFHFHRPSEERINGRQFEMVLHLVHKATDGKLAVVAVMLARGQANPAVQTVWNHLPLERGAEVAPPASLDLAQLLPEDRRYLTYMGSLTTPPCSEDVLWLVLKTPVTLSAEQLAIFARLYPMNARPLQPTNGRMVKESN